jgi:Domain of unknown function (DUF1996)
VKFLLALVSAAIVTAAAVSGSPSAVRAQGVNFVGSCAFSHMAKDDPIVFPGFAGLSHDHTFVGAVSTNASSTLRSLRASATTCKRPGETAAYWMPTLLQAGAPVAPRGATIYYRRRTMGRIRAFPAGLKVIAGDSRASSPQSTKVTFWNCGPQAGVAPSSSVPTCAGGRTTSLRLHVRFPDCWDGRTLDSADHKSHMAYSERRQCPADHPVAVPAVELIFRYPIAGGADVTLSSGGQYSAHADFFNAWNQGALTRLVNQCLNAFRHCGRGD